MHITQYWHAPSVPPDITPLLASYREVNLDLAYRCFDEAAAARFIADHFSPREVAAFRACAVPAMQADYFRYCAVIVVGGFYADADTRCLKPLAPLLDGEHTGILFQRPNGNVINGFFAFKAPRHSLLEITLEIATVNIEQRVSQSVWTVAGPSIFTALHYVSQMTRGEKYSDYGPDSEFHALMERCDKAVRRRGCDPARVFDGLRIAHTDVHFEYLTDVQATYKATPGHWLHWPGSIYRES